MGRQVDERPEQVEEGTHLQGLADGGHVLHGRVEERCMQVGHVARLERAFQVVGVVAEAHTVLLHHVAGAAYGGGAVVAVLGHVVACTGHHEAGAGGDVECVLAVAARADDVNGVDVAKVHRHARGQESVAESDDFVNQCPAHLEHREQRRNLRFGVLSVGDARH